MEVKKSKEVSIKNNNGIDLLNIINLNKLNTGL